MNDAVDRMVVEIYRKKRESGCKSIVLTGCSPEAGTTTNVINLAIALSVAGWNTLLVDCDLRKGPAHKRLNEEAETGLTDYLTGNANQQDITYETTYTELSYIPCGSHCDSPVRLFCSHNMEQLVEELEQKYDYVIFDFPSISVASDVEILMPFVDSIALVAALDITSKKQLREAREKLAPLGEKYLGVIINAVPMKQYKKQFKDFDYFSEQSYLENYQRKQKNHKVKKENNRTDSKKQAKADLKK